MFCFARYMLPSKESDPTEKLKILVSPPFTFVGTFFIEGSLDVLGYFRRQMYTALSQLQRPSPKDHENSPFYVR